MAQPKPPKPAVQLIAVFSRHPVAIDWAIERCQSQWGPIAARSSLFDHSETSYYAAEMGEQLWKQFIVIDGLYDPATLACCKLQTNAWEEELAVS